MFKLNFIYGILGCLAALASAAAWAFGSILFRRLGDEVSPLGMNLGKSIIGILYLGVVLLLIKVEPVDSRTFFFIGISGLLGIALGDTFFFKALINLGAKTTLLLGTLGPVLTVVLSVIFLHERPSLSGGLGILFTVGGIAWVMSETSPMERIKKNWASGIKYSLLSSLCISIGIIFAKIGIASIPSIQAALIRFLFSVIGLAVYGIANHQIRNWMLPFKNFCSLRLILFADFIVIFGGFWLFLVALKYIEASTAAILNSTTPLFILPMTAFISKEKISIQTIIGAIVATGGIALIFIG